MKVKEFIKMLGLVDQELEIETINRRFINKLQIDRIKGETNDIKSMNIREICHIYADGEARQTLELLFNIEVGG